MNARLSALTLCLGLAFGAGAGLAQDRAPRLLNERATVRAYAKAKVAPYVSRWIPTAGAPGGFVFANTRLDPGTEVTILAYRYYSPSDRSMTVKRDGKRRIKFALVRAGAVEGWIPTFQLSTGDSAGGGGIVGGVGDDAFFGKLQTAAQGLWYTGGEGDTEVSVVKFDTVVRTGADLVKALGRDPRTSTELGTRPDPVGDLINQGWLEEVEQYDSAAAAEQWRELRTLLQTLTNVREIRMADARMDQGELKWNDLGGDSHFVYLLGEDSTGKTVGIHVYIVWT